MIVGTAGHVDHGKTSLVRALTGVDTDRLVEEKARGISIELGFAYTRFDADEEPIGFVDVPGHRRFVQTMIAGAAGIDVGLLVVAADDGPMPQTREHVDILQWLGVPRLVVALTKIDAVDADRTAVAADEIEELLADTPYRGATIVRVAAPRGEGLDALQAALLACRSTDPVSSGGRFRLAVDRAFVLQGIGLVVTGTCFAGHVAIDDTITLLPGSLTARVRGIHAQNRTVSAAHAGQRVALNLVGRGVERGAVKRGDWAVAPAAAFETDRIDVWVPAREAPLALDEREWKHMRFHAGAASAHARVALLESHDEGVLAQIVFERPLHVLAGDRFVLRDDGGTGDESTSVAGGIVLDVDVPARGRRSDERLALLRTAARGDARATLAAAVEASAKGVDLGRWNTTHDTAFGAHDMDARPVGDDASGVTLFAPALWRAHLERVEAALREEHARTPDAVGPGRDRLRRMAAPAMTATTFGALLDTLKSEGRLAQTGAWLHLPEHRVVIPQADRDRFDRIRGAYVASDANNPPRVRDVARSLDEEESAVRATFVRLAAVGDVYRIAHDHYYLPETVRALAQVVIELADAEGVAKAAPFRDKIGIGRKVAIQILEFFDRVGLTRRIGDDHRVIQPTLFDT